MIRAGHVSPGVILKLVHEKTVIERVRLFIEENENTGRRSHFGSLEKLQVQRVKTVRQLAWIADHGIHGHAANAFPIRGRVAVGGALVNSCGAAGKWPEFRI